MLYRHKGDILEPTEITVADGTLGIGDNAFKSSQLSNIIVRNKNVFFENYAVGSIHNLNRFHTGYGENDSGDYIWNRQVLQGYAGSTAEAYAREFSLEFIELTEPDVNYGDLNGDGAVNTKDLTLMR